MDFNVYIGRTIKEGYEEYKGDGVECTLTCEESKTGNPSFYVSCYKKRGYDESINLVVTLCLNERKEIEDVVFETFVGNDETPWERDKLWRNMNLHSHAVQ